MGSGVPTRPTRWSVSGVLVVVDEDGLTALLLPPGRRHQRRRAPFDLASEGDGGSPHLDESPSRLDPHAHVDTPTAARLWETDITEVGQRPNDVKRDPAGSSKPVPG